MTTEHVNRLLACLPNSSLPLDIQQWLRELFRHQHVDVDLDERDELIRTIIELSPGESATARCCFFLDALGGKPHPVAAADSLICRLRATGVAVPQSTKQLLRILDSRRQDGWRETTDLCPSPAVLEDAGNSKERAK